MTVLAQTTSWLGSEIGMMVCSKKLGRDTVESWTAVREPEGRRHEKLTSG